MSDEPRDDLGPAEEPDTRAKSVALPIEEGDRVVAQQNVGAEGSAGSGEWPEPDAEPTGPSPGTTPEGAQAASRREQAPPQRGTGRTFKPALDAEPVPGGSQAVPDE